MRFDDREELMVEVYNDVAVRRCPLTLSESLAMLSEVKGARLLRGFRGRPPADVAALADTLVRVSWLAVHLTGHLTELDINPLMVLPAGRGVKAVDALAVLPSPRSGAHDLPTRPWHCLTFLLASSYYLSPSRRCGRTPSRAWLHANASPPRECARHRLGR